ncbi:hypothetical protein GGI20_003512 [Coemansia sp. BCRC 34301]|nr:hypothetical protein GGI20_003512 [Coemansia sp. BCRC 34301]
MSCVICCESLFDHISGLGGSRVASSDSTADRSSHDWADRPSVLTCGHVFHQGCISAWLAQSNHGTCPTCRTKHTGEAIAMYFDVEAKDDSQAFPDCADSPQVKHRNKVIKTLCSNIESALAEVKAANQQLDDANARYEAKEQERIKEVQNSQLMKSRASAFKKTVHELKTQNMKLEASVAEQARQIESLQSANATLSAELDEQKRVVEVMGDVRRTNEKLVRSLKTERSRVETQLTLNTQLASRIASLERTHLPLPAEGAPLTSTVAAADSSAGASQGISEIDLTEEVCDRDYEGLEEDTAAISRSIAMSLGKPKKPSATARRAATFELPVAAFDHTDSGADANLNPFAATPIQAMKFDPPSLSFFVPPGSSELSTKDPLVTSSKQIQGRHIRALRRPTVALAAISDGLGGSRQEGGFGTRRPASSVQSKINWGPKR